MRIVVFFMLWIVFSLGTPLSMHVLFGSQEYPLVSIGAVIGFVGGALVSALITGLFRDDQPSGSK
jgi:energy-converting hydrogenase Eha subunit A